MEKFNLGCACRWCVPSGGSTTCGLRLQAWTRPVAMMLLLQFTITASGETTSGHDTTTATPTSSSQEWYHIFAYVCFALGAVLLLIGFIRLIWWACTYKEQSTWKRNNLTNHFSTYYHDPWLKESSLVSRRNQGFEEESLSGSGEAIYAQPVDSRHTMPQIPEPDYNRLDTELSQTESQIYDDSGRGSGGNGGGSSNSNIYSYPNKINYPNKSNNSKYSNDPLNAVDEDTRVTPELPARHPDLELDRLQRSPLNERSIALTEEDNGDAGSFSSRHRKDRHEAPPSELSGRELYNAVYFRDRYGEEVPPSPERAVPDGSMKSTRSLSPYMSQTEPVAVDREMEYNFVSSFH